MDLFTELKQDHFKCQDKAQVVYPWPKAKFIDRMKDCFTSLTNEERG